MGFYQKSETTQKVIHFIFTCTIIFVLIWSLIVPQNSVSAAASLTITPITWNVVGLDSNNVNVGPNLFPVGARVCNTGNAQATNVSSQFVWGTDETPLKSYISLRTGSKLSYSGYTIDVGKCTDFYYEVAVTRDSNAYEDTRAYKISATADGVSTIYTPDKREIFVEHLISQNRNATDYVYFGAVGQALNTMTSVGAGGTMNLAVGQTYDIVLDAHTATQGYNQLESFINFPNTIFQIQKIATVYTANSSTFVLNTNDMLYADACLWDNTVGSETYRECIGSDGKSGGRVITRYTIKILSGGGTTQPLNTLLYDFSGSSFHYNSDFESGIRFATIGSPVTISKSFSPNPITTLTSGERIATLTLNLANTTGTQLDNVSITDPLPSGMTVATPVTATTDAQCLSAFSPSAGATSITYTGNIASSGDSTCTLTVKVKVSADGTFNNITSSVLVNSIDTGVTGSSVLAAKTTTASCTGSQTLAQWTFPSSAFTTPGSGTAPSTTGTPLITASASKGSGVTAREDTSNSTLVTPSDNTVSWSIGDFVTTTTLDTANNEYIEFSLNTNNLSQVDMSFDHFRDSSGPKKIAVYGVSGVRTCGTAGRKK